MTPPSGGPAPARLGRPAVVATLAGLGWFLACLASVLAPSGHLATEPLNFLSWENTAMIASPRNEPCAVQLPLAPDPAGERRFRHRLALRLPAYQGPTGRIGPDQFVPDFTVRSADLGTIGLYLETEAGLDARWQGDTPLGLIEGTLRLPDGSTYRLVHPTGARRGRLAEFAPASPAAGPLRDGELELITREAFPLFLRGLVRTAPPNTDERTLPPLGRLVAPLDAGPAHPPGTRLLFYPEGRCAYPAPGPAPSRLDLLAAIHQITPQQLVAGLALSGLLLGGGAMLLQCAANAPRAGRRCGAGVASLALGLSLAASILAPPLHGPDEARHTLSFARLTQDPSVLDAMKDLGERTHYERLKWRSDERLSRHTLEHPAGFYLAESTLDPAVIEAFIQDYRRRSPLAAILWSLATRPLSPLEPGQIALGLRFLGCVVAAALLGLGGGVLGSALPPGAGRWLVAAPLGLFSVPPLLATVGNYALLIAAAGCAGACLLAQAARFETRTGVAALTGIALGLMLHTSLNAVPLIVAAALWMLHRPWVRWLEADPAPVASSGRSIARWWAALALGFGLTRLLSTSAFNQALAELPQRLPPPLEALGPLLQEPALAWTAYCLVVGALEGLAALRPLPGLAAWGRGWLSGLTPVLGAVAVALALHAAWFSLQPPVVLADLERPWRQYPAIPATGCPVRTVDELGVELESLTRTNQLLEVGKVLGSNLAFRPRDVILVRAFWAGLLGGEARVPAWVAPLGSTLCIAGLVQGCLVLARARSPRRTLLLAFGIAALAVALALLTLGYWPRNLYGRYAMPALLIGIMAAGLGWRTTLNRLGDAAPTLLAVVLLALLVAVHGTWVLVLSERFFGA